MANNTAIARKQEVFVMEETVRGTLVPPTATGLVIAAGMASINQQPSFTNSSNIRNSRDVLERFQDRTPAGEWSCPVYITPSGAAGTAPQENVLLKSLLGEETLVTSTSATYSPALEKPSFSLWIKKDHTVLSLTGCTVGSASFALATTGGAKLDMSGKGMRMGWAGTGATAATLASGGTSVEVDDAKKFTVGMPIEFVESDVVKNNTNTGYYLTAVNTTSNVISFTGTGDTAEEEIASGSIVRGWLPTGTEVGSPLESRKGVAKIDGASFNVQSMNCSISDDPKYLDDEITTSGYIEDYAETERNVSGTISIYFRQDDLGYFNDGLEDTAKALQMVIGDTAGSIVTISMPTSRLSVPSIKEIDPTLALDIPYIALGDTGEDSISIAYT
jgi:hypothetical protein